MDTKQRKTASSGSKRRSASTERRRSPASGDPAARRKASAETPRRNPGSAGASRRRAKKPSVSSEVVYTPAKAFSRGRLLLQLGIIAAVVLALTFGMSIFFKVENVVVSGSEKYSPWTVRQASGIQEGDSLLSFSKTKMASNIRAKLPYVDDVRIHRVLPDTVHIEIVELDVVYAVRDSGNGWWLITSEGTVIEQVNGAVAGEYTNVTGFSIENPIVGQNCVAKEITDMPTDENGMPVPITVFGRDRLAAALSILQFMEAESIIGAVTSVDVEDLGKIEIQYGQQYRVTLGDTTQLGYKISCMNQVVQELEDYESGVIDVSFTINPVQPIYTPY